MGKNLTNNEIKKAFMICNNLEDGYCSDCPFENCDRCIRQVKRNGGRIAMKNRDFKMRERYEQKEYYPDKYGETRLDRIINRKLIKQSEKEKAKWSKEMVGEDNDSK